MRHLIYLISLDIAGTYEFSPALLVLGLNYFINAHLASSLVESVKSRMHTLHTLHAYVRTYGRMGGIPRIRQYDRRFIYSLLY